MKKITLQDIANASGVSRVTIWKAFNKPESVSDALRTKIIHTALSLGYPLNPEIIDQTPAPLLSLKGHSPHMPFHIALVVSRPETSIFWGRIITSLSEELSHTNTNLSVICLPHTTDTDYVLPGAFTDGSLHGLVIMNVYSSLLFRALNQLPLPKVFLDCIPGVHFNDINGDLVLFEGRSTTESIVRHVTEQGYKKIAFIGDISYAQTNYERYIGYCSGLEQAGIPLLPKYCLTGPIESDSYQMEINAFLDSFKEMPDMIVCASDYIAQLTTQQLVLLGYRIPDNIMVSGFDDNFEFTHTRHITTVHVQNKNTGILLAEQILRRLSHPDTDYQIIYIRSKVVFRSSTQKAPASDL